MKHTKKKDKEKLKGKSKTEISAAVDEWALSDRNRKIIKASLVDNVGYEKIAEDMGLSQKTVQRVMNEWAALVLKNL